MKCYYKLLYVDELSNDKIVLTYRRFVDPSGLAAFFGKKTMVEEVKFIGSGYNWKLYPNGPTCDHSESLMCQRDSQRKNFRYDY